MKKTILLAGAFYLLFGASGCGGDSHETYVKEIIDVYKETLGKLKKIKDVASAKDQAAALKELGERLKSLRRKADDLKEPLAEDEKKRLEKEYRKKVQEVLSDTVKEWDRVKALKGVEIALNDQGALDSWGYSQ